MIIHHSKSTWREKAKEVGEKLQPIAREVDKTGEYDPRALELLIESKLIAPILPEVYGGSGVCETECQDIMEEVCKANTSAGSMIACQLMAAYAFLSGASDDQKKLYLPKMAAGEIIGVPAITEKDAGSDVSAIQMTAVRDGDDYILDGEKTLISFYGIADIYVVFAKTNPEKKHKGISAFIVNSSNNGLELTYRYNKMGQRGMPTGSLQFRSCRIPAKDLIGSEGEGFKIAMELLNRSRILMASQAIGISMAAYEAAVDYATKRKTFGNSLSSHQVIAFKLADMAIGLKTARLAAQEAAIKYEKGENYLMDVAVAKVYASEVCQKIVNESLQIHGGIGYTTEYDIERLYRDSRIIELYGGASEIQRLVISRMILEDPKLM
ncbi:acyl-CoA dehydrogenase [Neobacillus bataviensis LMG 21833]|uniref:Acyl-CoA dehydrogenase n=1 Tax=Neobacillus bataviensis LMG 21833 TaxID=1117379 RepID=K6C725_9BACI|nr:acyl-CoA dehydrogenase family protein [Neobacillus bataviensis]EKN66940.1 acyl-CoA dehydrogenase [Neobacillus bataviensis LMG 21833]